MPREGLLSKLFKEISMREQINGIEVEKPEPDSTSEELGITYPDEESEDLVTEIGDAANQDDNVNIKVTKTEVRIKPEELGQAEDVEIETIATHEELVDAIKNIDELIGEAIDEVATADDPDSVDVDLSDIGLLMDKVSPEFRAKLVFTAATNNKSAQDFTDRLRRNLSSILANPVTLNYDKEGDFNNRDIQHICDAWDLPMLLVRGGNDALHGHYMLGLKEPEKHNGSWRILVYNPMNKGEYFIDLPNDFKNGLSSGVMLIRNLNWGHLSTAERDFTLPGDIELADHLYRAKSGDIQNIGDVHNCGPLCIFAAMLRAAMKEGPNAFKTSGRKKVEEATRTTLADGTVLPGVKIYTREEIEEGLEWGEASEDEQNLLNSIDI